MHDHLIAHLVDAHTRAYQHADGSEGWWGLFGKTYDWQVWGATDRGRFTGGYRMVWISRMKQLFVKVRESGRLLWKQVPLCDRAGMA